MASAKTVLTELATAVGMVQEPGSSPLDGLDRLCVPGIPEATWRSAVHDAVAGGGTNRDLVLVALANGRAFRQHVLGGRLPTAIDWTGPAQATWTSDIPRDLTVDGVYFVQAKFDSTCVLNTSPAALADSLLADDGITTRRSWFEEVARSELQSYYDTVRGRTASHAPLDTDAAIAALPADVRDLSAADRAALKVAMAATTPTPDEDTAYLHLARAVSVETALRWERRLRAATPTQRTQMLFRMLRIAGGPYWLLGTKGRTPVRLAVCDTRTWRQQFTLKRFDVTAGRAGQPQVEWRAVVAERATGCEHVIEGICELRWSHGKFQGNPECKVQVATPLRALPGYAPLPT